MSDPNVPSTVNVPTQPSLLSTTNWANVFMIVTAVAAYFHIVIPPDLGPAVLAVAIPALALYNIVKKTWFTTHITAASAVRLLGK